jgi:hypothetical protein
MYGHAHEEMKHNFLVELSSFCNYVDVSYFVGSDFNILRHVLEKYKPTVLPHSSKVFNSVIHSLALRKSI